MTIEERNKSNSDAMRNFAGMEFDNAVIAYIKTGHWYVNEENMIVYSEEELNTKFDDYTKHDF